MKKATLIIFKRKLGWYWRLVAPNNRILAAGVEPFSTWGKARLSYERACTTPYETRVDEQGARRRR